MPHHFSMFQLMRLCREERCLREVVFESICLSEVSRWRCKIEVIDVLGFFSLLSLWRLANTLVKLFVLVLSVQLQV